MAGDAKAEIVSGALVFIPPSGGRPGFAAGEIFISLRQYVRRTGTGRAFGDNVGFLVNLPGRQSFSPDAAYYLGSQSDGFLQGAPVFAVEVRSAGDYGPAAEQDMRLKRADYFAAGTLVVWDVDILRSREVRVYRATDPDTPTIYHAGELAEAEPAVPGWSMPVSDLFD
jgi:Uma2 family endonuclease